MKIALGSDHAGFTLKNFVKKHLEKTYEVIDVGTDSLESVDYPIYGHKVGQLVASGECEKGIVICGSGIGISMAANKVKGARCALCHEPLSAKLSRQHNDANVVAFGARLIGEEMAINIIDEFLSTAFEGGRHQKRVNQIEEV